MDVDTVSNIIKENFLKTVDSAAQLDIEDETFKHQKHKGFIKGKYHLLLKISSEELVCMPKVKAHQKVYSCIDDQVRDYIHAFSIKIEG